MFFSSRAKTTTVVAAYDVSSCAVVGGHAVVGPGRAVRVLAQARSHAPFISDIDPVRLMESAATQLQEVVAAVRKNDIHHPTHVELVLASPWHFSQTRKIIFRKELPFVCTQDMVETLIAAEIQQVMKSQTSYFGSFSGEYVVVGKQISQIALNGYPTENPYGKKINQIEIGLILTIAPKVVVDRFVAILERTYGARRIAVTASPYVSYVALRDSVGIAPDAVIVDVGEEVTDVAFIKDDLFLLQHSFPVGTHGVYRALATHGNYSDAEVKAHLMGFRLGKLAPKAKKNVEQAIATFITNWQRGMREVVAEGHFGFTLPDQCFVLSDTAFEKLFIQALSRDIFIQERSTSNAFAPTYVGNSIVNDIVITTGNSEPDTTLALIFMFLERLIHQ